MTKSLTALLSQMFQNDPKKRPTAWDLLHFEFFRNDDQLLEEDPAFSAIFGDAATSDGKGLQPHHFRRESITAPQSRYAKEFVEDGRLGRGGFGEVFKARNKVEYVFSLCLLLWTQFRVLGHVLGVSTFDTCTYAR